MFESSRTYGLFTAYFDEELYRYAANYYETHGFGRNRRVYSVVGIAEVVEDVEISRRNYTPYRNMQSFFEQDFCMVHDNDNAAIIDKFKRYFTARVDIQLKPKTQGDFQILSVSDDKANVWKPGWFNKNGIGYQIHSYSDSMEIVAKATVDGQLNLNLRGLDIRSPEDNTKRIPQWIDYTKLTVNGKVVFDKVTPAWHDKAYSCRFDVKADEEIKIQVEWQPHKSDNFNVPSKADNAAIIDRFKDYFTARLDIKLMTTAGDFQIFSVSDDKALIQKPAWFNKGGTGYVIQSYAGNLEFIAKAAADGQIRLSLLGLDVRDAEDRSKRIPYWIDYTKLTVNNNVIFDKLIPAWHDKSYQYALNAKAGEEIKIQVEWLPHRSDV